MIHLIMKKSLAFDGDDFPIYYTETREEAEEWISLVRADRVKFVEVRRKFLDEHDINPYNVLHSYDAELISEVKGCDDGLWKLLSLGVEIYERTGLTRQNFYAKVSEMTGFYSSFSEELIFNDWHNPGFDDLGIEQLGEAPW